MTVLVVMLRSVPSQVSTVIPIQMVVLALSVLLTRTVMVLLVQPSPVLTTRNPPLDPPRLATVLIMESLAPLVLVLIRQKLQAA